MTLTVTLSDMSRRTLHVFAGEPADAVVDLEQATGLVAIDWEQEA